MRTRLYLLWITCFLLSVSARAQYGSDLGEPSISKLMWKQIQSTASQGIHETIGLTTDNKMYVWGTNYHFWIHSKAVPSGLSTPAGYALVQTTPYYLPSPAGETVTKVAAAAANVFLSSGSATSWVATFGCLTQSGKLYGWGMNIGTFANAAAGWAPVPSGTSFTALDSTLVKRTPQQLTILGESTFVDFSFSSVSNFWVAIGASGKAYHIGANGDATYSSSFAALPIPAGADPATFKYVRVWCPNSLQGSQPVLLYLKGNDGKIYYSGEVGWGMAMGVPAYFSNANTNTYPDAGGSPPSALRNLRTDIPQLVPFPAGEDIVKMEFSGGGRASETFYALSATGKAFASGLWGVWYRDFVVSDFTNKRFFAYPLAKMPVLGTELDKTFIPNKADTLYTLKRFCEIAMPAGASKIIDIDDFGPSNSEADREWRATLIVTDNNKAYWAGRQQRDYYIFPNYVQYSDPYFIGRCDGVGPVVTPSQTQWTVEAINYRGIAQLFAPSDAGGAELRRFIVSKTGKAYFEGRITPGSGLGKLSGSGGAPYAYQPMPIANEQLDNCNSNPGVALGGTADPTPGVGAIDCSKTKLSPAPVAGVPSQLTLSVTVNVTTAGSFSLLSVSGSGMSLGNGITSVSSTTTGVQTFSIPVNYDGSTLTNAFQFTIGQAGGCTADLTTKPNNEITKVWSLTNCSAITPGVLSK